MNVRCINVENYKLTEGKIYPIAEESRDFYKLLNDNNIGVRYHKRLFEVVPEAPAVAPTPPPPPPRTEADLVESIRIVDNRVTYTDFNRETKSVINRFARHDSSISCGVKQYSGINNQISEIDNLFDLDTDDYITIRKALFRKCLEQYIQVPSTRNNAFSLLSTNTSGTDDGHDADEDMLRVLDEVAVVVTPEVNNPNSNRTIKVWVLQSA